MNNFLKITMTAATVFAMNTNVFAADTIVTIGTGGVTGVYYPAGGAICRLVNKDRKEHGVRCSVEATGGSVYNVNTIASGELEFGVTQSDVQHNAFSGKDKYSGKAVTDLRSVLALHPEPFTVVARKDAKVTKIEDIKGKRVNVGNPGSGSREMTEVVLKTLGMTIKDLALATEHKPAEMAKELCDGNIDVMIYTVGHPAAAIKEASATCDVVVVPVEGAAIDKLVADNAFYRKAVIPGKMYKGTDSDVNTFGVAATIVTSAKVPEKVVYTVTKAVMGNLEEFKKLHPAFENLKAEEMTKEGLSAPLHDGAKKAFQEMKLMQ